MARGTGATTRQMQAASAGATFIWCNRNTGYAVALAQRLGRTDLKIESPEWMTVHNIRGRPPYPQFVVLLDHATRLNAEQRSAFDEYAARAAQA